MIGMARQNRYGAVNLLRRHDAHELMRPSHGTKSQNLMRLCPQGRIKPIGPTNGQNESGRPAITHTANVLRKGFTANAFATLIQKNKPRTRRNERANGARFFRLAVFRPACPTFFDFAKFDPRQSN